MVACRWPRASDQKPSCSCNGPNVQRTAVDTGGLGMDCPGAEEQQKTTGVVPRFGTPMKLTWPRAPQKAPSIVEVCGRRLRGCPASATWNPPAAAVRRCWVSGRRLFDVKPGSSFQGGPPNRGGCTITNNYRNPDASRAAGYQTLHQELASASSRGCSDTSLKIFLHVFFFRHNAFCQRTSLHDHWPQMTDRICTLQRNMSPLRLKRF